MNPANKLTLVCMVTLVLGGVPAWIIVAQGGPEALGAIIPLFLIGAVHLFIGPLAVFHAFTHYNKYSLIIYAYFILFLVAAIWLMNIEGIVFYVLYIAFMTIPILWAIIVTYYKRTH